MCPFEKSERDGERNGIESDVEHDREGSEIFSCRTTMLSIEFHAIVRCVCVYVYTRAKEKKSKWERENFWRTPNFSRTTARVENLLFIL